MHQDSQLGMLTPSRNWFLTSKISRSLNACIWKCKKEITSHVRYYYPVGGKLPVVIYLTKIWLAACWSSSKTLYEYSPTEMLKSKQWTRLYCLQLHFGRRVGSQGRRWIAGPPALSGRPHSRTCFHPAAPQWCAEPCAASPAKCADPAREVNRTAVKGVSGANASTGAGLLGKREERRIAAAVSLTGTQNYLHLSDIVRIKHSFTRARQAFPTTNTTSSNFKCECYLILIKQQTGFKP